MSWCRALLAACVLASPPGLFADELSVAVAGNFAPVLARLGPGFEAASGHRLAVSSGSTGKLYAQIVHGAPYEVFLAADRERPERLESEGRIVEGSRASYALGRLVLWGPALADEAALKARLLADPPPRLAIANPRLAPYGAAAESWLRNEGLWDRLAPRMVRGESIAQAFHFTASGNAELGLVARSQLASAGIGPAAPDDPSVQAMDPESTASQGARWVVPASAHPPIEQQMVLLDDTEAARAFRDWLLSEATQSRLREFGYDSP